MDSNGFPQEVVEALGCYVYRLIDPRSGETFYVGRGRGQRIFSHASGEVDDENQDAVDPKLARIREIRALGMDVQHVIHRHGMSEAVAIGGRSRGGADRRLSRAGQYCSGFRLEGPRYAARE